MSPLSNKQGWQAFVMAILFTLVGTFGGLWLTGVGNAQAQVQDLTGRVLVLETNEKNTRELLKEIRDEIRAMREIATQYDARASRPAR